MSEKLVELDTDKIRQVAQVVKQLDIKPDPFTDPRYYPDVNADLELAVAYFFTMIAIDHRTHLKKAYILEIDGTVYRGADLLWRLGKMMFDENPDFFRPENLARLDEDTVRKWLCPDELDLWDVNIRTYLLRDLGFKVIQYFNSRFSTILEKCGGYLYRNGQGFAELLKIFRAFEDPVEKKIFLLVKFLTRRGYLKVIDKENVQIPVDNHVTRIAFRLGIVKVSKELEEMIRRNVEVTYSQDVEIRLTVRQAWKLVSEHANADVLLLDDFLWTHGRTVCTREEPKCTLCPLKDVCSAYSTGKYLPEHVYTLTWYY